MATGFIQQEIVLAIGVAVMVGCGNYKHSDATHEILAKELIKNNVLVLATGCSATTLGRAGACGPQRLKNLPVPV